MAMVALAMQLGLVFCHWWWVWALGKPGDLIVHGGQYDGFAQQGGDVYWLWRAAPVAIFATVALFPVKWWIRELALGIQFGWLAVLTVMYFQAPYLGTGPGAYIPIAWIALIVMWLSWRGVDVGRQGAS
ncbi:MAG: hypothetical protein ACRYGR_02385 [Janthinobacterium lividum]